MKNIFKKIFGTVLLTGISLFLFSACYVESEDPMETYAKKPSVNVCLFQVRQTKIKSKNVFFVTLNITLNTICKSQ